MEKSVFMLKLKSLKSKILVPGIGMTVIVLLFIAVYASTSIRSLADGMASERAAMISRAVSQRLQELKTYSALTAYFAADSEIIAAFIQANAAGQSPDREAVLAYLLIRKEEMGVGNLLVLDNQGYCLMRTNLPHIYGDSMAASPGVQSALQGDITTAFGVGAHVIRMSLSTYTPIFVDGAQAGVFIARTTMNTDEFVDEFAGIFDAQVTIYSDREAVATTIRDAEDSRLLGSIADETIAERVLVQNATFNDLIPLNGEPHHVYAFPLHDITEAAIGIFLVGFSHAPTIAATSESVRNMISISLIGLAIMGVGMLFHIGRLIKPVSLLTQTLGDTAKGDLTRRLPERGNDGTSPR